MSSPLAPNKIHHLPVRVTYYLPSTSQIFSTIFPSPQQVYVHPNTAASSTKDGAEEEAWGSIYLKTIVLGVLMASPELHPSYPNTPDLTLYVLDPRETYLRRCRAESSSYITNPNRNYQSSSPAPSSDNASSPNFSYGIPQQTTEAVWTGKGSISWAIAEPGQGKNLITGRLVRSIDFTNITKSKGLNPLEALMMSDSNGSPKEENWGIEISVGLQSGINGSIGLNNKIPNVVKMEDRPDALRRTSTSSSTETNVSTSINQQPASSHLLRPDYHLPRRHEQQSRRPQLPTPSSSSSAHQPLGPTRSVSTGRNTSAKPAETIPPKPAGGKRRRTKNNPTGSSRNSLGAIDPNSDATKRRGTTIPPPSSHSHVKRSSAPSSDAIEPFPTDIPAGLFARPESLTREQAQRLLASPAFLSMLEKLTGAPIDASKQSKEGDDSLESNSGGPSNKKPKLSHVHGHSRKGSTDSIGDSNPNGFVCWNCGRTKSAVWRTKVMEGGKSVRVCNACGLYWNKMGSMRPPTLWGDVDDDPKDRPRKDKKGGSSGPEPSSTRQSSQPPNSEPDIPALRIDKPVTRSHDHNGFKRTLSSVVEEDARRIAALHAHSHPRKPMPKSNLHHTSKPVPMSSPPRGSTSATKSLTNPKWNHQVAASSPIKWSRQDDRTAPPSDNFHTDPVEAPVMTARHHQQGRLPHNSHTDNRSNKQTLDMPLSDDSPQPTNQKPLLNQDQNQGWGTDFSAFFDTEGFSMPPPYSNPFQGTRTHGISPDVGPPSEFQKSLSAEARKLRKQHTHQSSSTSIGTDQSTEEDDVLSQLFNQTSSSVGLEGESSPNQDQNSNLKRFDFSSLPPSSPPIDENSDLPHSALLLSSPDNSPLNDLNDFSPIEQIKSNTPINKSNLRHSFSFNHNNNEGNKENQNHNININSGIEGLGFEDIQRMLNNINSNQHQNQHQNHDNKSIKINSTNDQQQGFDMLNEIFNQLNQNIVNNQNHATSSVGQADEILGELNGLSSHSGGGNTDDIFSMLNNGAFN